MRHGESEANVARVHGSAKYPLTEKGKEQARFIAERCKNLPIQKIVASSMIRAQQTAEVIGETLQLPIDTTDLLIECQGPKRFMDRHYEDPDTKAGYETIIKNFASGYRFEDEENFDDLKERGLKALEYLRALPDEHILVVSHGLFLSVLMACAVFGKDLSSHECGQMMNKFLMRNTGLSIFEYSPFDELYDMEVKQGWRVWTWNDHAHLAE